MMPKVSVVMPVWNGEKYLRAAVESILSQTFQDFELIAADDGSKDGTIAILESYSDPRVRILRLDHGGIVLTLNRGVMAAHADLIARQDADDISCPTRLAKQVEAMARAPSAVLCYTDALVLRDGKSAAQPSRFPRTKALLALRLCYQNPIVHSTVLFRKEAFLRSGGYQSSERHAEDFALWGRMLEIADFVALPEPLLDFRVHPASVSKQNLVLQGALASGIAIDHCARFMKLSESEARRAYQVLSLAPRQRSGSEWRWFISHCAPRLRWKSNEVRAWLLLQTLKQLL